MRIKVVLFTLSLGMLFCQLAKAEPVDRFKVREWEEYLSLSPGDQSLYLTGLRLLINELATLEEKDGLDYSMVSTPARSVASVEERSCIYAGWLKLISINGRYCERPPSQGCAQGSVQCNPLVFGRGVCAQAGAKATAGCVRNAKPAETVARELTAKDREEWISFKADLDSYCTRGRQASVCHLVQTRLAQMERVVSDKPRPQRNVTTSMTKPVTTTSVVMRKTQLVRASLEVPSLTAPAPLKSVDLASTEPSFTSKPGKCDTIGLLEEIKSSAGSGVPVLWPLQAQALICERGPIDQNLFASRRKLLNAMIAQSSGTTSDARYYRKWLTTLVDNLDACVAEAEQLRATHALVKPRLVPVVLEGGGMVTLVNGFSVNGKTVIRPNTSTHINYLGRMMGLTSFGICDLEFRAPGGGTLLPSGASAIQ